MYVGNETSFCSLQREENRFFAHHKLRQSQSVDLYRAQLEEKDKTIAAMKQAAKVTNFLQSESSYFPDTTSILIHCWISASPFVFDRLKRIIH